MKRETLPGLLALSFVVGASAVVGCFGDDNAGPMGDSGAPGTDGGGADGTAGPDSSGPYADGAAPDSHAEAGPPVAPGIYVTSVNNSVQVFAADAIGDTAPLRTITGASTQLSIPIGLGVDSQGYLYVANRGGGAVTVYAPTANGDATPVRTLTATGMGSPEGIAIGPGDDVYVSTCPGCGSANGGVNGVFHFPSGSSQSDTSIVGDANDLTNSSSIALDESGNIWVGNAFGGDVARFSAGASGDAGASISFTPTPTINLQSLAYASGTLFITAPSIGVELYPATSAVDASAPTTIAASTELPLNYPGGIFVDTHGAQPVIYLADYGADAIYVIQTSGTAPNLSVASVATLSGASTGLNPLDVFVVPAN